MNGFVFLILIAWIVLSAVSKKKKREAAEAAKRRAAEQAAMNATGAQSFDAPAERPVPKPPAPRPPELQNPVFDPFFGGLSDAKSEPDRNARQPLSQQSAPATASRPMTPPPQARQQTRVQSNMSTNMADRTTTMHSTLRHALEASSVTGHAHTESSITGIEPECPPEKPRSRFAAPETAAPVPSAVSANAFTWNVNDVTRGLILSEILGKPKALRQ